MDLEDNIPLPEGAKKYSHYGRAHKNVKGALIRCPLVDNISRSTLVCNHLLWRDRPGELRAHLAEHGIVADTDDQVLGYFVPAKAIFLERIPEDGDPDDDLDEVDEEESEEDE